MTKAQPQLVQPEPEPVNPPVGAPAPSVPTDSFGQSIAAANLLAYPNAPSLAGLERTTIRSLPEEVKQKLTNYAQLELQELAYNVILFSNGRATLNKIIEGLYTIYRYTIGVGRASLTKQLNQLVADGALVKGEKRTEYVIPSNKQ